MQHAPRDYQGIMAQIAEAVRSQIRHNRLAPVVITEALDGNGFTFARIERTVKLADVPEMHGRITVFGGHSPPLAVDLNHQFDHDDVERGALMILDRLDNEFNWI